MDRIQIRSYFQKHGYLGISIISMSVMILAVGLFDSVSIETIAQLNDALDWKEQSVGSNNSGDALLTEIRARYFWLASALLNIVIPLYAATLALVIIVRCHTGTRLKFILALVLVVCVFNVCIMLYYAESESAFYRVVYGVTNYLLAHSNRFDEHFMRTIYWIIGSINLLAFIAPIIIAFAFASTIAPLQSGQALTLNDLSTRMQYLRTILHAASALLVIGTLHMATWLQWPSSLIVEAELRANFSKAALSVSTYWGAAFALMLFLTYGPAAAFLSNQARNLLDHLSPKSETISDPNTWLRNHNLSSNLGDQLPQIMMMLAPAIVAPVESMLLNTG